MRIFHIHTLQAQVPKGPVYSHIADYLLSNFLFFLPNILQFVQSILITYCIVKKGSNDHKNVLILGYLIYFWKCNFPMNHSLSVCQSKKNCPNFEMSEFW